ncbi:hypothetical protein [uncultured Gilliamella sp.]|uniref:hypothetical protein n=1 Tax=uncultured Gilliamella sp. TaxID=1193505 RepID=UPI0025ED531F|nr:hypothetical protein [uncultured Gilliamella sp.]
MIETKTHIENELQEKARLLTIETLKEYVIPAEVNEKMTLGIEYHHNGDRFYFLYIPGEPATKGIDIIRTYGNIHTRECKVIYIGLDKKINTPFNEITKQDILGSIIAVPFNDCYFVAAQVLYVSYVNATILLGIYGDKVQNPNEISNPPKYPNQFSHLIYSNVQYIKNNDWSIVYFSEVADNYKDLARRIVDNELWLNDTRIRKATDSDKRVFDIMELKSKAEVEHIITQYFQLNSISTS